MKLTKEQIEVAVEWWKEVLRNPKFDNGDNSEMGAMTHMMATIGNKSPTEELLEKFGENLRKILEKEERGEWLTLSVDYGPGYLLRDAFEEAGGDSGSIITFPWKTGMSFQDGGVQVSYGYGAESKELLK